MPEQWLAVADADKIHEYVFSPRELRLIKGGSFLQSRLNREIIPAAIHGGECISKNGGTVVAKFATRESAEEFCGAAERAFRRETISATISTAVAKYGPGLWAESKDELDDRLEKCKYSARKRRFSGASPGWKVCEACGLFPAARLYRTPSEEKWICQTCEMRRKSNQDPPEWYRRLPSADTFEDIGESARPKNYLAVVYIDLDRMGKHMGDHGVSEDEWRRLSESVDGGIVSSVTAGCRAAGDPCQVLLAGGDDAIIALPADKLLAFLRAFNGEFHKQDFGGFPRPKYSVGAILANSHFPIFEFRRLAEELLRSAKREPENSVDFAVLTASMTDSIVREREAMAARTLGPKRTAKPYTIAHLFDLEVALREMKEAKVPSSKVRPLYQMVFEGRLQADLDYLYLLSRLETKHRDVLRKAVGPQLWRSGPNGSETTVAADLVELWDFVYDTKVVD